DSVMRPATLWRHDGSESSFHVELKLSEIGSGRQFDASFRFVAGFLVILRQLFANLRGAGANNRVLTRVVVRRTAENLNSERALLEALHVTHYGVLGDASQQVLTAAAGTENRTGEHPVQLGQDLLGSLRR